MPKGFKFNCTSCNQSIRAYPEHIGCKLQCPHCGQSLRVPDPLDEKPDELVQHKLFTEEELALIAHFDPEFRDMALGLSHSRYWQYTLAARLIQHEVQPMQGVVLDIAREQAKLDEWLKDHDRFIALVRDKANEFFGILYLLQDMMVNQFEPSLRQDSVERIVDAVRRMSMAFQRLTDYHQSLFATALPPEYPYQELQGIMKGWVPFCWQSVRSMAEKMQVVRVQRRCTVLEQRLQASFAPPTLSQFFITINYLPRRIVFER